MKTDGTRAMSTAGNNVAQKEWIHKVEDSAQDPAQVSRALLQLEENWSMGMAGVRGPKLVN